MRFQVFRAKDWLHRGLSVLPLLDRRGAYCVQGMSGLQRRLLDHIQERPDRALAQPLSLSPWERAWVTTRRGLGRRRVPERHPAEIMR
jgi:phytoene/squalene synthetase